MTVENLFTDANKIIIFIILLLPLIITIALIFAIFNISKRQSRQDAGQDVIIKLLKENNRNTQLLTEELEVINKNVYAICDNIYELCNNYENSVNDEPPIE